MERPLCAFLYEDRKGLAFIHIWIIINDDNLARALFQKALKSFLTTYVHRSTNERRYHHGHFLKSPQGPLPFGSVFLLTSLQTFWLSKPLGK